MGVTRFANIDYILKEYNKKLEICILLLLYTEKKKLKFKKYPEIHAFCKSD